MSLSFLKQKKKGFTLIEALVSLGIFSIVVVAATGVILSIISSNKKNQAISSVVNNLNYSIESMVRDIKTGYRYKCSFIGAGTDLLLENYKLDSGTCGTLGQESPDITLVSTISGKEQIVRYELVNDGDKAYIKKTLYTESGGTVTPSSYALTDTKNISIEKLRFFIKTPPSVIPKQEGIFPGQPSVQLILKGTAKVNQINISDFFIQTFISQRLPNFI